jgi:hypothetical protein
MRQQWQQARMQHEQSLQLCTNTGHKTALQHHSQQQQGSSLEVRQQQLETGYLETRQWQHQGQEQQQPGSSACMQSQPVLLQQQQQPAELHGQAVTAPRAAQPHAVPRMNPQDVQVSLPCSPSHTTRTSSSGGTLSPARSPAPAADSLSVQRGDSTGSVSVRTDENRGVDSAPGPASLTAEASFVGQQELGSDAAGVYGDLSLAQQAPSARMQDLQNLLLTMVVLQQQEQQLQAALAAMRCADTEVPESTQSQLASSAATAAAPATEGSATGLPDTPAAATATCSLVSPAASTAVVATSSTTEAGTVLAEPCDESLPAAAPSTPAAQCPAALAAIAAAAQQLPRLPGGKTASQAILAIGCAADPTLQVSGESWGSDDLTFQQHGSDDSSSWCGDDTAMGGGCDLTPSACPSAVIPAPQAVSHCQLCIRYAQLAAPPQAAHKQSMGRISSIGVPHHDEQWVPAALTAREVVPAGSAGAGAAGALGPAASVGQVVRQRPAAGVNLAAETELPVATDRGAAAAGVRTSSFRKGNENLQRPATRTSTGTPLSSHSSKSNATVPKRHISSAGMRGSQQTTGVSGVVVGPSGVQAGGFVASSGAMRVSWYDVPVLQDECSRDALAPLAAASQQQMPAAPSGW